ncbi:MAG: tetratricopeptide repeat protein, partial [Pseudolabrys sp.]
DRIVSLVQRLDASDSRLGHLEAIERGLADLLVHIEDMRANKNGGPLRADHSPGVDALKSDIARTQDALDSVNGTLGLVVDRLASIERDIRGETRQNNHQDTRQERPRILTDEETAELRQPVGRLAVRVVNDAPPLQAAVPAPKAPPAPPPAPTPAPRRLPPAATLPINPDLPPDQPLEPGSGPPPLRTGARISASDAASSTGASSAGGQSGFIAAARRAAQAAVKTPSERTPRMDAPENDGDETPSLRGKMMKRVKSLFIAASIIGVVVGSIQIASNFYDFGSGPSVNSAKAPDQDTNEIATVTPERPAGMAATLPGPLNLSEFVPAKTPGTLSPMPGEPSLLSPPLLDNKNDTTGSIPRRPQPAAKPPQAAAPILDQLPIAIGGAKLRSAAVAGDAAASYEVALRFAEGRGVPASLEAAAHWFERAAVKGLAPAQFRYASLLEKGQGGRKDLAQARKLYLAAAGKGNAKAMHNLAVLYAEGIDGKPDYVTAAQWFRKAALRGIADSQYNLGVLCARGLGMEKNVDESYKWFALAAAQGDKEAAKKRDEVAEHLDPAALQVANEAIKSFAPEPQPEEAFKVPEPVGGWDGTTGAVSTPQPHAKPRNPGPMSLGSFEIGKR